MQGFKSCAGYSCNTKGISKMQQPFFSNDNKQKKDSDEFSLEKILKDHMKLLAQKAKSENCCENLSSLTHAIVELAPLIQSLSDDGLVSYPVQVQLSMQDLTDLYRGRHLSQHRMLFDNEKRLNQVP